MVLNKARFGEDCPEERHSSEVLLSVAKELHRWANLNNRPDKKKSPHIAGLGLNNGRGITDKLVGQAFWPPGPMILPDLVLFCRVAPSGRFSVFAFAAGMRKLVVNYEGNQHRIKHLAFLSALREPPPRGFEPLNQNLPHAASDSHAFCPSWRPIRVPLLLAAALYYRIQDRRSMQGLEFCEVICDFRLLHFTKFRHKRKQWQPGFPPNLFRRVIADSRFAIGVDTLSA